VALNDFFANRQSNAGSGVFLSRQKDIEIESGTEMLVGIIGQ